MAALVSKQCLETAVFDLAIYAIRMPLSLRGPIPNSLPCISLVGTLFVQSMKTPAYGGAFLPGDVFALGPVCEFCVISGIF